MPRSAAAEAGVGALDLRLGDLREPPVDERVPLVTCPFRAYSTCATTRSGSARSAPPASCSCPGGRLVFDVFTPGREDIEETHGRWIEREPGIFERADWDRRADADALRARAERGDRRWRCGGSSRARWHALLAEAGFEVHACYGWFDRRPFAGGEDSVWIAGSKMIRANCDKSESDPAQIATNGRRRVLTW